jgi:D-serine deaminase-like pyridoxal phosphate-dependent protein
MEQHAVAWYAIKNVDELDSPVLVVYPGRVKHNIRQAIAMVGEVNRLRPHVKTHKCAEVARLMMDAGIQKFKCATIAEAEMLAMQNAPDVLLAYQPAGPKLKRFVQLALRYPNTKFACLTDNATVAAEQSRAFAAAGLTINIYLDLNVGMNRTGIIPGAEAVQLYTAMMGLPGLQLMGLHAYDGHIRYPEFAQKEKQGNLAFEPVQQMKEALVKMGLPLPVIIVGGSPSFSVHCQRPGVECSPGTFIYWDHGYSQLCPEQAFLPAAVLITRVVSLPTETRVCTDLGHKSVAAENEIGKRVHFLNADNLEPVAQSEEHLVLEAAPAHAFRPGDLLYALPYHVCPTVALYEKVVLVENGLARQEWRNIARDRSIGC